MPSSPMAYVRDDAPPFFLAHGTNDTVVPLRSATRFVEHLKSISARPVVYVRLPGAQHAFDLFHSLRFESVVDGIEAFAAAARSAQAVRRGHELARRRRCTGRRR